MVKFGMCLGNHSQLSFENKTKLAQTTKSLKGAKTPKQHNEATLALPTGRAKLAKISASVSVF